MGCTSADCIITLKSSSEGKYLEASSGDSVVAKTQQINEEAKWYISFVTGRAINLKSKVSGKYLTANPAGPLKHDRDAAGSWETFELKGPVGGGYPLQTAHNRYVTVTANGAVNGNQINIDDAEPFKINVCSDCE